ncbi:tetratricopeptide repeat protein [Candidatus Dependentiae bacterium]|nr:tetratricopeptide repeat protein [Candidatus Dependentiae bacterium]
MGKKTKKIQDARVLSKKAAADQPKTNVPRLTIWYKILPPTLLSMIATAFYYPSLKYPFQFDDLANITKKFDIRFSNPLSGWWTNRRWMGEWINRLNFEWGRFDPFYYRLTNVVIHIAAGVLIFFLILEGCSRLKTKPFLSKNALLIAFTTAALFMLHPVQTQAVSYVIQARLEGLATLFVVATLLLILKAFQTNALIFRIPLIILALVVGLLSCGTKEIAIVSPFLALLLDWFFLAQGEWSSFKKRIWFHALFSFVIFAKFVQYFSPQFFSDIIQLKQTTANNRGNILTKHAHDTITSLAYLISEFKVILHYLVIFLWPLTMSVEYDWKLSESFFSPDSFFPFLILASLFALAVYTLMKNKYSFFGFGIFWFFIAVSPRSTIIPSPELICDYKTYLASVGWLFIIATSFAASLDWLLQKIKVTKPIVYKPIIQLAACTMLALPIGYGAMNRNVVWSTSVEFWRDISIKAPLKARGHNNLGVALSEENKFDEAIPCYLEAIKLDRHYSDPWSNLAVAYSVKGQTDKAIGALKQAIRIFPNYPEAYNNLGTLMIKKKNYDAAEKILRIAIKLRPYYGKAFYNLGRLYMDQGNMEQAWVNFEKATEGDLDTVEGFYTLGQVGLKLKKFAEAANAFTFALKRGQNVQPKQRDQILFNLANAHFMNKDYDKAQPVFELLCQASPHEHRFLYNLGETLYSKQDYAGAVEVFKKLSRPPFGIAQANFRYANCLEKLNLLPEARSVLQAINNSSSIPEKMKQMAQNEIGRITIQEKINKGNCTLTMKDLRQAFNASGTGQA